jgi:HAD superfamily hydrolase (TIGR01509 family)
LVKAVIFDIDGTLIDSVDYHAEAWQKAFKKFGKEIAFYELRRQVGKGGDLFLPVFLLQKEIDEFGKQVEEARGEIFKRQYLKKIKPFPKVRELFLKLRKESKRIVLASSAKEEELEAYKKIARISDLIEEQTSTDDAEHSKPEPDIFLAALRKLKNVNRSEAVIIGDTCYDVEAAVKAKIKCVGVLSGGWAKSELLKTGCAEVYRDAADILKNFKTGALA